MRKVVHTYDKQEIQNKKRKRKNNARKNTTMKGEKSSSYI